MWFRTRFIAVLLFFSAPAHAQQSDPAAAGRLNSLSLEELGNIEVTTASKGPVKLSQTAAAIFVITQEDIRRAGVKLSLIHI